jgi:hypothetical protein
MAITLDGTNGVTAPLFDGPLDAADLTGDVAAARITGALNATGSAPIYACRAWVNFNGTGTVAIRASGNVSSITDNGAGNYYVNLANSMPDTNYSVVITKQNETSNLDASVADDISSRLVNRIQVYTLEAGSASDSANINVSVFR